MHLKIQYNTDKQYHKILKTILGVCTLITLIC